MKKYLHSYLLRVSSRYRRYIKRRDLFNEIEQLGREIRKTRPSSTDLENIYDIGERTAAIRLYLDDLRDFLAISHEVHQLEMKAIQLYYRDKRVKPLQEIRDTLDMKLQKITYEKLTSGL